MTIEGRSLGALLDRLVVGNVSGGTTYDAFVAETARQHEHRLVTLDQRAAKTYQLVGVEYVLLDASEL